MPIFQKSHFGKKSTKPFFRNFSAGFAYYCEENCFFWAINHAESEKIVNFSRRPHILKIFDFFQKSPNFFFQNSQNWRSEKFFYEDLTSNRIPWLILPLSWIGFGKISIGGKAINLSSFLPNSSPLCHGPCYEIVQWGKNKYPMVLWVRNYGTNKIVTF